LQPDKIFLGVNMFNLEIGCLLHINFQCGFFLCKHTFASGAFVCCTIINSEPVLMFTMYLYWFFSMASTIHKQMILSQLCWSESAHQKALIWAKFLKNWEASTFVTKLIKSDFLLHIGKLIQYIYNNSKLFVVTSCCTW